MADKLNDMQTPPPWTAAGRHGVFPEGTHDDHARFHFLSNLVKYTSDNLLRGNQVAYEHRAKPAFTAQHGHEPQDRKEIRAAMSTDPHYQIASAIRRNNMEMRQQTGRSMVLRQIYELREKARELNQDQPTLQLDPDLEIPRYISAVDHHCMPGSYHTELIEDDVSAAANYDSGIIVTAQGLFGRCSDGAGQGVVKWLQENHPTLELKRALEIGCGLGHNTVPLATALPDVEVIGVDVAAPMLRYGHARARSMGIGNLTFRQANGEQLDYADESFDFIFTAIFLHETSYKAIHRIMAEIHRLLRPGGLHIHLEQPPYDDMPLFEQFLRDWDTYYNNEPFWNTMYSMDLYDVMAGAGFNRERMFQSTVTAVVDEELFPKADADTEDFGRGAIWHTIGGIK